jgi:hypothetical protein
MTIAVYALDPPVSRANSAFDSHVALGVVEAPYISVLGDRRSFARTELADFGRLRILVVSSGRYLSSGLLPLSRGLLSRGLGPSRGLRSRGFDPSRG